MIAANANNNSNDSGGSNNSETSQTGSRNACPEVDLRFRSSHSMLFHPVLRKLFVFGGQRKREDSLNDFFSYNVDSDDVEIISVGSEFVASQASAGGGGAGAGGGGVPGSWMWGPIIPAVGHTQRATIDFERHEIHVMTVGRHNNTCKVRFDHAFCYFRA